MIRAEKSRHALAALHRVLIMSRSIAYDGRSPLVAEALDVAEYLVVLMLDTKDQTSEFRDYLLALRDLSAEFATAVEVFDAEIPWR